MVVFNAGMKKIVLPVSQALVHILKNKNNMIELVKQ